MEGGQCPDEGDHGEGALLGALRQVGQRRANRPVPIEAENEQIQYGGSGGGVVGHQPQLTHRQAERPVAEEDVHRRDGHHHQTNCQVGHRQREDEHLALRPDGMHDHGIAEEGKE
ncbi:hypothetical protein TYRP_004916 [Tyrophagus putrescentiae]|nr:hypothetical protein TYRP_004916 [Tyrophagus putrescentiae]